MPPGFTSIDDGAILRSREVGPSAFLVYAAIAQHVREDRRAWPGIDRLAAITGLSRRTVQLAISALRHAGWVVVDASRGRGNVYTLPPIESSATDCATPDKSSAIHCAPPAQLIAPGSATGCAGVAQLVAQEGNHRSKPRRKPMKETRRGCTAEVVFPSELDSESFREAWTRWTDYRRQRRLTCAVVTLDGQLKKLATLGPTKAVEEIDNSIAHGWQSVCYKPGGNGMAKNNFADGPGQKFDPARKSNVPVVGGF
jgi:hypothetical protein